MPAFTVTVAELTSTWLALIVTFAAALTLIPAAASFTELPLLSVISREPVPSFSMIFWPPGVSTMKFSWPLSSSRVTFTPLRERRTFLLLFVSIFSGGGLVLLHSPPRT